jgi:hexosaminidase
MHLDVARHYMPVDFIKKYIDYLAAYKFNTFHWHLTDDQGWRIEIKKYPLLTQVGGWRNGTIIGRYPGKGNTDTKHGGFYTQQQVKEIVQYAADRYITVIPEIEMPGHASAAIAAYPQLSCFPDEDTKIPPDCIWSGAAKGKMVQQTWGVFEDVFAPTDYTFNFLQDVLDEVMPLFPSKYIHIGGDECPKEAWKRSAFCQQLIKEKNLKDEHGLQSYFINRIEKYLNSKGRNIIGWDEILEGGLAPNATVMSWRGEEGGIEAAKQNHDVIMTPGKPVYFDHSQSKNEDSVTIGGYNSIEAVYAYEPIPKVLNEAQAKYILGAQANLWTEYITNPEKVEYMIFPRMLALSEVLWSPKEKRNWNDFERRLPVLFERLEKQKVNYSKAYYDLKTIIQPSATAASGIEWKVSTKNKQENIKLQYAGPMRIMLQKQGKGEAVIPVTHQGNYNAATDISGLNIFQKFSFNKATGKKITLANEASKGYPGDGAFTLVNGVQNELGLTKSSEFLGFNGKDLDVTIDLGAVTEVKKVTLHSLGQIGSWIHLPTSVEVQYIVVLDSGSNNRMPPIQFQTKEVTPQRGKVKIELAGAYECRYIRVIAKNIGVIPQGNPGAGEKAWLFADEIEVE